jgi:hypothetical protein
MSTIPDHASSLDARIAAELDRFRAEGVYKQLNYLQSPQAPRVLMEGLACGSRIRPIRTPNAATATTT